MVSVVSRTSRRPLQRYINGRRVVVGCIPYRYSSGNKATTERKVEVLVITSQKSQAILFPKGGLEIGESVEGGAYRETREEAGVIGTIQGFLGHWSYKSKTQEAFHEGMMFSLLVTDQLELWQEKGTRQRIWMDIETAMLKCRDWWMREALERLVDRLATGAQTASPDCDHRFDQINSFLQAACTPKLFEDQFDQTNTLVVLDQAV